MASIEPDIDVDIAFRCMIGNTKARLGIYIEPDPHGNRNGEHAHFHTTILCRKVEVVDWPVPDKCQITGDTCTFWTPVSGPERDSSARKWRYAHELIHVMAGVEFYGTQLINSVTGKSRDDLTLKNVVKCLTELHLVDSQIHDTLENLRANRNRLAHNPDEYLKFEETSLYELSQEARRVSNIIMQRLAQVPHSNPG